MTAAPPIDESPLAGTRCRIDAIDLQLLELLNRRAALAQEIAALKQDGDAPPVFYRPEREAEIFAQLRARNRGPLDDAAVGAAFREIISACRALEHRCRVVLGGNTPQLTAAALRQFGSSIDLQAAADAEAACGAVQAGEADYAVVPDNAAYPLPEALRVLGEQEGAGAAPCLVLGRQFTRPTGSDRTRVRLQLEAAGGTAEVLASLEREGVEVLAAETLEDGRVLRLQLRGHPEDAPIAAALRALAAPVAALRVEGGYPDPGARR